MRPSIASAVFTGTALHNLEKMRRESGAICWFTKKCCCKRCFRRRFCDYRIACCNGGPELVAKQVQWIVERRYRTDNTNRHVGDGRLTVHAARNNCAVQNFAVNKRCHVTGQSQCVRC